MVPIQIQTEVIFKQWIKIILKIRLRSNSFMQGKTIFIGKTKKIGFKLIIIQTVCIKPQNFPDIFCELVCVVNVWGSNSLFCFWKNMCAHGVITALVCVAEMVMRRICSPYSLDLILSVLPKVRCNLLKWLGMQSQYRKLRWKSKNFHAHSILHCCWQPPQWGTHAHSTSVKRRWKWHKRFSSRG